MVAQDRQQLAFSQGALGEYKLEPFWPDFEAKIPDLFATEPTNCKVEVLNISPKYTSSSAEEGEGIGIGSVKLTEGVSDVEELDNALNQSFTPGASTIVILNRFNSWSRINASIGIFSAICAYCQVKPLFLKVLMGFGKRLSATDEDFMGCYAYLSTTDGRRRSFDHNNDRVINRAVLASVYENKLAISCNLPTATHEDFQDQIQNVSSELKNYGQTVKKLLGRSSDIRSMYDDILKFYGQEVMNLNSVRLTQIAQANSVETKAMTSLTDATARDSRVMRIAAVIAMVYLPANLVMSFFSTVLVEYKNASGGSGAYSSTLYVHRETWIAVLSTSILAILTFISSWCWMRRENGRRGCNVC
ncbi:hypothetical protein M426DRAFT_8796 [Hypoxylon sp. CI-4A]|nr:hypothetical protein M426DRAFT_8796 [Hypoxylon sp. CI-4A]